MVLAVIASFQGSCVSEAFFGACRSTPCASASSRKSSSVAAMSSVFRVLGLGFRVSGVGFRFGI